MTRRQRGSGPALAAAPAAARAAVLVAVLLAAVLAAVPAAPALAQGIIAPPDPPMPRPIDPPPGPAGLTMESLSVEAQVAAGVARVRVSQRYVNQGQVNAEGTYIFPLPAGATIQSFRMFINDEPLGGELLSAEEARGIYERIVARNRDPALLQYVGKGAISAQVFPVPPGEERTIELEYTQVVPRDGDLYQLALPAGGAPRVAITAQLEARDPLAAIYSPTHNIQVTRDGDRRATVSFEGDGGRQSRYLELYFGVGGGEVSADLLTYAAAGEDGYFLLLVNPRAGAEPGEVQAKDVVLVLDTSGSMEGRKLAQAKGALAFVLERLGPDDRFGLVAFHSTVQPYADELQPAAQAGAAIDWVHGLSARGSTNISGALAAAQELAAAGALPDRPQVIIFLTDGLPTVGLRTPSEILAGARRAGTERQRIFPFGVGHDVNTLLLDGLAEEHGGISTYVQPGEDIEEKVAAFYRKVAAPVLTGLSLAVDGVRISDTYPQPLGDLFAGSQLVVAGRYRGSGTATVELSGTLNGRRRTFRFPDLEFPARATGRDFVARLWAGRKIAWLLNQVRLYGDNSELVDEIVALSQRYGIMTPYTSFLIQEPGMAAADGTVVEQVRAAAGSAPQSGGAAVDRSQRLGALKSAVTLQDQAAAAPVPAGEPQAEYVLGSGDLYTPVRTGGDKTFIFREGAWTDTAYQAGTPLTPVAFGSPAYFGLAARHGPYLAVGLPLVVVIDGEAYRIEDTGEPAQPGSGGPLPQNGGGAAGSSGAGGEGVGGGQAAPGGGPGEPHLTRAAVSVAAALALAAALGGAGLLGARRRRRR